MVKLTSKSGPRDWLKWVSIGRAWDSGLRPEEVANVAIKEIDRLRAENERLRAELDSRQSAEVISELNSGIFPAHKMGCYLRNAQPGTMGQCDCFQGGDAPDDGYLPGLNSTMCDAPLRSPEEQFTRRMLKEAIARCLFANLPNEREWLWFTTSQKLVHLPNTGDSIEFVLDIESAKKCLVLESEDDLRIGFIPAPIWDKAWEECGMEDR